jgi:hypothetical protein
MSGKTPALERFQALLARALDGASSTEEARTSAMAACRLLGPGGELAVVVRTHARMVSRGGPELEDDVLFVLVQGPLERGGRRVHVVESLPASWPSAPARSLCGEMLRLSGGASMMQVTRNRVSSVADDVFLSWPTSRLCDTCSYGLSR